MATEEAQGYLFQKVNHVSSGKQFDLGFLKDGTYDEPMDLSGPRFMLRFDDQYSYIRDTISLKELDEVEIRVADIPGRGGLDFTYTCVVIKNEPVGDCVKLALVPKEIYGVKRPKDQTQLFVQKGAKSILSAFFPDVQQDTSDFPVVEDYHYIAGERPALMLRQMAREQGAHVFFNRGQVIMKTLEEMMQQEPVATYSYGNPNADNQIIMYKVPGFQALMKEQIKRPAFAFGEQRGTLDILSEIAGKLLSGDVAGAANSVADAMNEQGRIKKTVAAPVISSLQNPTSIANLQKAALPCFDMTCVGNGFLRPGQALAVRIEKNQAADPYDESIPKKMVISEASHFYSAQKYYTRVKCVVPLE